MIFLSFLLILSAFLMYLSLLYLVDVSQMTIFVDRDRSNHFALHGCCNIFMLYCAVLNHSPGIPCGILNLIVQSPFLLKLCSHCPGLAPQFARGKSNQGKPGRTVRNRDRTLVLPWQTGKINRGAFMVV